MEESSAELKILPPIKSCTGLALEAPLNAFTSLPFILDLPTFANCLPHRDRLPLLPREGDRTEGSDPVSLMDNLKREMFSAARKSSSPVARKSGVMSSGNWTLQYLCASSSELFDTLDSDRSRVAVIGVPTFPFPLGDLRDEGMNSGAFGFPTPVPVILPLPLPPDDLWEDGTNSAAFGLRVVVFIDVEVLFDRFNLLSIWFEPPIIDKFMIV